MIRYLLDTNIVSEGARLLPDPRVLARFQARRGETAIPSPVWQELIYGVERLPLGQRRTLLEQYLTGVVRPALPVLPYDEAAAHWHARERACLERLGRPRAFIDGMIAAVAATHDLILVTRSLDDFAGFEGLHLENWFDT